MKLSPFHPAHLVIGLGVWSVWFVGIYSALSLYCHVSPEANTSASSLSALENLSALTTLNISLIIVSSILAAVLFLLGVWCWRAGSSAKISAGLYWAAAISTAIITLPIFYFPPCL